MSENIKCRMISKGKENGEVIVTKDPISFLGGVDPETGIIIDKKHELYNHCITDKILVIPSGKGSTVGSYVIYQMTKNNTAPKLLFARKLNLLLLLVQSFLRFLW